MWSEGQRCGFAGSALCVCAFGVLLSGPLRRIGGAAAPETKRRHLFLLESMIDQR